MKEGFLSEEQERVLVELLNVENDSVYDCRTTMRTMYALLERNLIERTNYKDVVWFGWERTGMKFKLTLSGRMLAQKFTEQKSEAQKQ